MKQNSELTEEQLADLRQAIATMKAGGVIVYPTDTVWGIGCDATNAAAVKRIYDIKRRDDSKALITLVHNVAMLERIVDSVPDVAYDLVECADKPLTIVYDKATGVAPNLPAPDGTLAVRVTSDPFAASLCQRLGRPIVSTSANISGRPTPGTFADIEEDIKQAADYVCTTRQADTTPARPSGIIRLKADGEFKIIR